MPALTPEFVMNLETRMSFVTESAYTDASKNLWWKQIAKVRNSTTGKEILTWLLSTAQIYRAGAFGGQFRFEDIVSAKLEMEPEYANAGLRLHEKQFEDTDGNGVNLAMQWSSDLGIYMAYWPQAETVRFLKNAHTAALFPCYDDPAGSRAFFAAGHPYNPADLSKGYFANLWTGAEVTGTGATATPGALPIDYSVTLEVALMNLAKGVAYIQSIKTPNGEMPRYLRPKWIACGPALYPRVCQLLGAKSIATAAGAAAAQGGSSDVEAFIKALEYASPLRIDELAGFESDTTYFVVCEQMATSQVGGVIYIERKPFDIRYFSGMGQGVLEMTLSRSKELEWQCSGRNGISSGHPYLLFKCKGS